MSSTETAYTPPLPLEIVMERTPNPEACKFVFNQPVSPHGPLAFSEERAAEHSPFARLFFKLQGIKGVFLGHNFISITKDPAYAWEDLAAPIQAACVQAIEMRLPLWETTRSKEATATNSSDNPAPGAPTNVNEAAKAEVGTIERDIQDLLDQRIRPFVARDGGDITFDRFEEGTVYLHMRGACSGCPSASITLKRGVENLLKHFIPEVERVEAVTV